VGHVSTEVYKEWIRGAGGSHFLFVIVLLYGMGETARVGSSFWLGVWASDHFDRACRDTRHLNLGPNTRQSKQTIMCFEHKDTSLTGRCAWELECVGCMFGDSLASPATAR
jgi:hypothetical protein